MAWCPARNEEESSVTGVAHKLLLHEGSSPQLHILSVGGQRSVGHRRWAPFNSGVVGKRQIKALSSSFCVVLPLFKADCHPCSKFYFNTFFHGYPTSVVVNYDSPVRQPG